MNIDICEKCGADRNSSADRDAKHCTCTYSHLKYMTADPTTRGGAVIHPATYCQKCGKLTNITDMVRIDGDWYCLHCFVSALDAHTKTEPNPLAEMPPPKLTITVNPPPMSDM